MERPDGTTETPPQTQQTPTTTSASSPATPIGGKDVKVLPQSAFRALKDRERDRGKREALAPLEAKAKALGYKTIDEMLTAFEAKKGQASTMQDRNDKAKQNAHGNQRQENGAQVQRERSVQDNRNDRDHRRQNAGWEREKTRYERQLADLKAKADREERKRKQIEDDLNHERTLGALRAAAARAGVKDIDTAIFKLDRVFASKDPERDAKFFQEFDEDKFFSGLRDSAPYLFNEAPVVPATTAPIASPAEVPLSPKNGMPRNGFTAMNAKPEEVQARLRALGIE